MNPATPPATDTEATKEINPASTAHAPRQAAPVMDVVPPRPAEKFLTPTPPSVSTQAAAAPAVTSVAPTSGGLATPPPETEDEKSSHDSKNAAEATEAKPAKQQAPAKPKPAGTNVAAIIATTVLVVAILSGLAVYAYLQSK